MAYIYDKFPPNKCADGGFADATFAANVKNIDPAIAVISCDNTTLVLPLTPDTNAYSVGDILVGTLDSASASEDFVVSTCTMISRKILKANFGTKNATFVTEPAVISDVFERALIHIPSLQSYLSNSQSGSRRRLAGLKPASVFRELEIPIAGVKIELESEFPGFSLGFSPDSHTKLDCSFTFVKIPVVIDSAKDSGWVGDVGKVLQDIVDFTAEFDILTYVLEYSCTMDFEPTFDVTIVSRQGSASVKKSLLPLSGPVEIPVPIPIKVRGVRVVVPFILSFNADLSVTAKLEGSPGQHERSIKGIGFSAVVDSVGFTFDTQKVKEFQFIYEDMFSSKFVHQPFKFLPGTDSTVSRGCKGALQIAMNLNLETKVSLGVPHVPLKGDLAALELGLDIGATWYGSLPGDEEQLSLAKAAGYSFPLCEDYSSACAPKDPHTLQGVTPTIKYSGKGDVRLGVDIDASGILKFNNGVKIIPYELDIFRASDLDSRFWKGLWFCTGAPLFADLTSCCSISPAGKSITTLCYTNPCIVAASKAPENSHAFQYLLLYLGVRKYLYLLICKLQAHLPGHPTLIQCKCCGLCSSAVCFTTLLVCA